jgi:general secretion pathway protein L
MRNNLLLRIGQDPRGLTTASIPGSNRQKLLRAVPYALEEQLTVDVEDLHFALGPALGNDRHAVLVIAIERLESILDACREADLEVSRVIPEQLAIPCPASGTCVVIHEDVALVRTGRYTGYAADTDNLGLLLSRQPVPEEESAGGELRIYKATGSELPDLGAAAETAVVEEYHGSGASCGGRGVRPRPCCWPVSWSAMSSWASITSA